MSDLDDYLNEQLKDPEFRKLMEEMEPRFQRLRKLINYEITNPITKGMKSRKNRAERLGISIFDIDRIDRMEELDYNVAEYVDNLLKDY